MALQAKLLQSAASDPSRAGLIKTIASLSEKATLLEDLAATLRGKYAAPKPKPPVAPPRSDVISFLTTLPAKVATRAANDCTFCSLPPRTQRTSCRSEVAGTTALAVLAAAVILIM